MNDIRTEILPYIDGNGLVAPFIVEPDTKRASDNGIMFTSEYYIILAYSKQDTIKDLLTYGKLVNSCVGSDGELHRAPGDTSPDEVDDHYGVLSGLAAYRLKPSFKLPVRLWRQPQLLYAYLLAKGISSLLMGPLAIYNAIVLATSCVGNPDSDADSRRLAWHLWQATKRKSWLATLAGKFWYWRQIKVYKTDTVMRSVALRYYQINHPFQKYWMDT